MIIGLIALPILAAIIMPFAGRRADIVFIITSSILLVISLSFIPATSVLVFETADLEMLGNFHFVIDGFSALMLVLIGFVGLVVGIFSIRWTQENSFYALLAISLAGMNGLVIVADIFTMYVFLEITSLSSFALIALLKNAEGLEAAIKYLVLSAVATAFILLGIFLIYGAAGSVGFSEIFLFAKDPAHSRVVTLCLSLFLIGFSIKSGLVPFHAWVPDAYAGAPNPISIALAGIITKTAGVYTLLRVTFNVFGMTASVSQIIMILGIVSAATGAIAAVTQDDSKRMLAYSSISQVGYIILGVSTGTVLGIVGGIFHLFNHAILKSLLFLNTSAIETATGSRSLSTMGGLATRMRVTGATFAIGSLSVAGIPPLNGFWSKLFIIVALFQSGNHVIAFIALLVSVVTLAYFLLFHKKALFGKVDEKFADVREVSFAGYLPAVLLAAIAILSGLFFTSFIDLLIKPAADILAKGVVL